MPDRFREHRARLADLIGADGIAIVPAAHETIRNDDVTHDFRQDSDFAYLTGFHEPESVAVLAPGNPDGEFVLFVRPKDRDNEIWTGYRAGIDGAKERFGADAAYELSDLDTVLRRMVVGRSSVFYRFGNPHHDQRVISLVGSGRQIQVRSGRMGPDRVVDLGRVLGEMRIVKSPAELDSLRAAGELSAEGHREAMRFTRPGLFEYQIQAAMEYVWREGGSRRNGYGSIVAAGSNACVLHYVENDSIVENGDLVLIDAAAEIDGYSADITRTFPASGRFSVAQRAVYEVVLAAQHAAIHLSRPGVTLKELHDESTRILTEGMVDLGLVPKGIDDSLAMHHYGEFFMHGTSHWLGLDVHDAGAYRANGRPRPLEPGMVFTVEPGIYLGADRPEVEFSMLEYDRDQWLQERVLDPEAARRQKTRLDEADKLTHRIPDEFLGIGVRIEDDILINVDGHENLTWPAPKEIDEVEALCAEDSWLTRQ